MDYKQDADKIVEMFMPYASAVVATDECVSWLPNNSRYIKHNAIQCAIKAVEMCVSVIDPEKEYERWKHWNEILNQLKQM